MGKRALWIAGLAVAGLALWLGAAITYRTQRGARPSAHALHAGSHEDERHGQAILVRDRLRAPAALPQRETKRLAGPEAEQARALLDGLASQMQRGLEADPLQARALQCELETPGDARCSDLRNDALWAAASFELLPRVTEAVAELQSLCQDDVECTKRELASRLQAPSSAFDLVVAMSMRLAVDPDHPIVLPPGLYERLDQRSDLEIQLILMTHQGVAVPDPEVADAIAALALAPTNSNRVRMAAVQALGHPENAPALRSVIDAFERGEPGTQALLAEVLPQALSRCGAPCAGDLDALAHHGDARVRRAAYRTLNFMADEERAQLSARWPATDTSNGE